jgi:hypothetical protein
MIHTSPIRRIPSAAGLLILVAGGLPAAELVVRDLRLGLASVPLSFDYDYGGSSASDAGSDSFDAGLGLEFGGRWSFARAGDALGVVVGADLLLDAASYSGTDGLATSWVRISAGPGWAITDRVTGFAEVGLQYGLSALTLPATASSPSFSATGTALGYDARVGATWLPTRRFGVGGYAGWLIASHDLSGDADLTVDQSGWFVGLELVWRFTDAPSRLE